MDAKELMIGDWVECDTLYPNKTQITMQDLLWISQGKEVKPIPLTAEILELNGWKRKPYTHTLYLQNDILTIDLNESYSQFGYTHLCDVETDCVVCSEICFVGTLYVHQLQHALRLCGLSDLADNFKVK